MKRMVVNLLAAHKKSGEPVFEEVLVDRVDTNCFRIVATPAVLLGVAADDVLEVAEDGTHKLVSRGGNIAVQLFGSQSLVASKLEELRELAPAADSRVGDITVLTVPARLGFARIEEVLNAFCTRHRGVSWYYGNVYDPADGVTPLNWWIK